ncbi:MAG: hypothetical protein ACNA8W_07965 [Bradymonadaceae bacterium]
MDDLNRMRLKRGLPLSTQGVETSEDANALMMDAMRLMGVDGRSCRIGRNNPAAKYQLCEWFPFGEYHDYPDLKMLCKVLGYQLERVELVEGATLLYFDSELDKGGCPQRLEIQEEYVIEVVRSLPLTQRTLPPVSEFSPRIGATLHKISAYCDGTLRLDWGARTNSLRWKSPYSSETESSRPKDAVKASRQVPFLAFVTEIKSTTT